MKLLNTKSMIRYLPQNGTAGLARSLVSGDRRGPLPPASTIPSTRMRIVFYQRLLFQASAGDSKGKLGKGSQPLKSLRDLEVRSQESEWPPAWAGMHGV